MSDSISAPPPVPETASPGAPLAADLVEHRPRRLPRGVSLALLFVLALGVRWTVLRSVPPATSRELDALDVATSAPLLPPRVDLADGTVTLLSLARRVVPDSAVGPSGVEGLRPPVDARIRAVRGLGAWLGAAAAVALALAAGSLGGRRSAIVAGGLLALSPFAVEHSVLAEPTALLLFAASGTLLAFARWADRPSAARAAAAGLCVGLAAAAGGGGAALLLGAPWAARRDGRVPLATLAACVLAAAFVVAVAAPGILAAFPSLPRGAADMSTSRSPLLAGLRTLATAAGWIVAALAVVGAARVLSRPEAAPRAVLAATLALFVTTLLRSGAAPALLAGALPGVILLASLALAEPRGAERALPWPRVLLAAALVAAAAGCTALLASCFAPKPADAAADWVRRNVPNGSTFLLEEPDVRVPTPSGLRTMNELAARGTVARARVDAYAAGSKTFEPVLLPAPGTRGREAALFYDPNLAQFFPWMILRDPPSPPDDASELVDTRRIFHDYFKSAWKQVAAFPSGLSRSPSLIVLERPEKFALDRARLAPLSPLLAGEVLDGVRKNSAPYTKWLKDAGVALRTGGEWLGARGFLEVVTERDPSDAEAHYELGLVRLLRQDEENAKKSLLTALDLDPHHGGAHYNLGVVLEAEGDLAGAETEYRAATLYLAAPAIAHARLGGLFAARGDTADARAALDDVRRLDPGGEADRYLSHVLGAP